MGEMRHLPLLLVAGAIGLCLVPSCVIEEETRRDRFDDDDGSGGASSASSGMGGSTSSTTSSSTTSSSTSSSSTTSSSSSGTNCPDPFDEPNDNEGSATDLGTIGDCDSSGGQTPGVLSGNEVDWFTYFGTDNQCVANPGISFQADGQVRVCQYAECEGLTVECPEGSSSDVSPQGRPGCCSEQGFVLDIECSSWWDEADIFIRIDKPPAFPCINYTLDYHY